MLCAEAYEFRELGAPSVQREDALARHPLRVELAEQTRRAAADVRVDLAADQYAVRLQQVLQRRTLCQELGVREHLQANGSK